MRAFFDDTDLAQIGTAFTRSLQQLTRKRGRLPENFHRRKPLGAFNRFSVLVRACFRVLDHIGSECDFQFVLLGKFKHLVQTSHAHASLGKAHWA